MSGFIGQVQLPNWTQINSEFSPDRVNLLHNQSVASQTLPDQAQANLLISQNQGASGSQDLLDRGTLRDNALGLAQRNPLAVATAASLPGIGGTGSVNSLSNFDAQTAASKLNLLQYSAGLPQMPYGGGASPGGGSAPTGGFMGQMSNSESGGNPATVNKQGYSGNFQFGTGRMADLGLYQPAQGENPNGNQWQGQFNIPGFPDVKTYADFLHGPVGQNGSRDLQRAADAQRMAAEVHFKDIGQQIDGTPGAQDYNRAGLAAVAQLGGVHGMQQFVATGGKYNPHDSNGTSLQNYYDKFSQTGMPGLQQSFGHPDGPLPGDHPARGVQTASAADTAGMPVTATDAVAGGAPNPAPGSTVADTPDQLQAKLAQMRAGGAAAPVPAPPDQPSTAVQGVNQFLQGQLLPQPGAAPAPVAPAQNTLMQPAPPTAAPPSAPPVAPAPQASVQQSAPTTGLPPGAVPIKTGMGLPYTTGAPAGYGWAQTPDKQLVPYPLVPPVLKEVKTPNAIINVDPRTGQEVSRIAIPETGRMTSVETPDGHQNYINGHPIGDPIPFSGRPQQNEAYQADQKTVAGITANAQAAQSIMPRLNEMAQIQPGLATGIGGETRSKIQAVLEQMGADPADAAKLTGISSAADADLYRKLATSTAGTAAKADLGANNGVEAMRIYQSANPGMNLQPDANKRITNMLRVQQQSVQDYADAVHQHFDPNEQQFLSGGKYVQPLSTFNRQWQAQANPQVYAAATGILNGDPYAKWADKISNPADAMRAAQIAARIDPNVAVPIAGGRMQPARSLLGTAH